MTPNRKHATKAMARKSKRKLASECLSDEITRKHILLSMNRIIQAEFKEMIKFESILCSLSPDHLKSFYWGMIYDELRLKAPVFLSFMMSLTKTKTPRKNRVAVICTCAAILLKYRF